MLMLSQLSTSTLVPRPGTIVRVDGNQTACGLVPPGSQGTQTGPVYEVDKTLQNPAFAHICYHHHPMYGKSAALVTVPTAERQPYKRTFCYLIKSLIYDK